MVVLFVSLDSLVITTFSSTDVETSSKLYNASICLELGLCPKLETGTSAEAVAETAVEAVKISVDHPEQQEVGELVGLQVGKVRREV